MTVLRIVPDMKTQEPEKLAAFYKQLLGLNEMMNFGWIVTTASDQSTNPQISFASEGGAGTPVPTLSIEVDNFEEVLAQAKAMDCSMEYGPVDEPWGVRRFFVRDLEGNLLNILTHKSTP